MGWKSSERSQCALKSLPPSFSQREKLFAGALGYWGRVREGSGSCGRCGSSSGVSRQLEYRDTAGGPRNSSSFSLHPCSCLLTGPSGRARAPRPAGEPGGSGKDKPPSALLGKTGEEDSAPEMGGTSTRNWLEEPFPAQNLPADPPRVGSPSSAGNLLGQGTSCVLIFNTHCPGPPEPGG